MKKLTHPSRRFFHRALTASLLAVLIHTPAYTQSPPGVGNTQSAIDRQTERAQQRAASNAQNRAIAAQNQTLDRVHQQAEKQAERAQQQAERVQVQADRAQAQTGRAVGRIAAAGDNRNSPPVVDTILNADARRNPASTPLPAQLAVSQTNRPTPFVEVTVETNVRVIEREWIMLVTESQRSQLQTDAPQLMRFLTQTSNLAVLESYLLKFSVPPDLDADGALLALVPESMRTLMDRNHVYALQDGSETARGGEAQALTLPMSPVCANPVSVGIIDSAIAAAHPAFAHHQAIISHRFINQEIAQPEGHGTAIASLLIGQGPGLNPLLPQGTLYSAAVVYSHGEYHQGTTAMHILQALDWLLAQDVGVINMSLTGPANRLLEQGINAAISRGKVIVAAAGNEGPHAPAAYPSAYEGVITATAVSSDRSIYRWANQGTHIDFASLGVSVTTARSDGSFGRESGTSMATPVVSAFLACALSAGHKSVAQALDELRAVAVDLGAPGRDPVFGYGLLHPSSAYASENSVASGGR
jgi:minor extracellular protease Epr